MSSTRRTVTIAAAATAVVLVGVGTAVAGSTDAEAPGGKATGQARAAEVRSEKADAGSDNGLHKGWDKIVDNPGQGKRSGWDRHGQHGGAPDIEARPGSGKSGQKHGKAGEKGKDSSQGHADGGPGKPGKPNAGKPPQD